MTEKSKFLFAVAVALFCSCTRETVQERPDESGTQITAYMVGAKEKTTLIDGGTKIYWEPGDELKVFTNDSDYRFTLLNKKIVSTAVFSCGQTLPVAPSYDDGFLLWALYPYDSEASFNGESIRTTLPTIQKGRAGSFAEGTSIAVGRSVNTQVGFLNVCGGVRFSLERDDISCVIFESLGSESVSGRFDIAFSDNLPVVGNVVAGKPLASLSAPDGGTFEAGKWYYISLLPGTLASGGKMTFLTSDKYAELLLNNPITVKRGTFGSIQNADSGLTFKSGYKLVDISFDKSGVEMYSGEELVLSPTLIPAPAVAPEMSWSSDNTSVATVAGGTVTAVAEGQTNITVTCLGKEAHITVTVSDRQAAIRKITLEGADCPFADYAEYGVYIPACNKLKGALILQHGCGMEQFGITRPYDLQYQALANKWNLAIVETALHGDCWVWRFMESGCMEGLMKALTEIGQSEDHPELATVPWLLWGHSGGAVWVLGVLRDYPERVIAAASYSAARDPEWTYVAPAGDIPVVLRHAGDNDGTPDMLVEQTSVNHMLKLRSLNGVACVAYNKGENHNLCHLRHFAIPLFEAALEARLSDDGTLRSISHDNTWIADKDEHTLYKESEYVGDKSKMCCFINESIAKKWKEYVETNDVADVTPPPAPHLLEAQRLSPSTVKINWKADADIESGIKRFIIKLDDVQVGILPQDSSIYQRFDTNGDNTIPVDPLPMEFTLNIPSGSSHRISVQTVNQFDLVSEKIEITFNS